MGGWRGEKDTPSVCRYVDWYTLYRPQHPHCACVVVRVGRRRRRRRASVRLPDGHVVLSVRALDDARCCAADIVHVDGGTRCLTTALLGLCGC